MKRFGLTALLRDDPAAIEAYERYHLDTWPEVLEDGIKAGVIQTCIYRHGRQLFMYMETDDTYEVDTFADKQSPRTLEWQRLMTSFMDVLPGAATGLPWVEMSVVVVTDRTEPGGR